MKTKNKILCFSLIILMLVFSPVTVLGTDGGNSGINQVILGGEPFGIKMLCDGVMVVRLENVQSENGDVNPAEEAGIRTEDIIISANGEHLESSEELKEIIEGYSGVAIVLKIMRDEESITAELNPAKDIEGNYKAGMWIKDSAAGLGTVTFYSQELGGFCALGHGICDSDTGQLIPLSKGDVNRACISSVTKSTTGNVGTLNGYFINEDIGDATKNLENGIYGKCTVSSSNKEAIEVADKEDVTTGEAYILCTVQGEEPQYYCVDIVKVSPK
ncbi:MAG: SpoIVB peptidase S55 domain-containing protein, partial [Ruminococcus sp.]